MSTQTILLVLVIFLLVFSFPRWGYNTSWGYGPFGVVGLLLVILLILRLLGQI